MLADRSADSRLKQLDGLRGLAALAVFFCHTVEMIVNDPRSLPVWPFLRSLWDGEAAVVLFFVLSGFVLTLPYVGPAPKKVDVAPFLVRRITRLYPAYWTAILLALFLRFVVYAPYGLHGITPWVAAIWSAPISAGSLLKHFLLIAPRLQFMQIDPVIWSLAIEVKVSLIFPAVLLLVQRTRRAPYALLAIALVFGCNFLGILGNFLAFLCGSYLAKYKGNVTAVLGSSRWLRAGLAVCAYVAYGASWSMPFFRGPLLGAITVVGASLFLSLFLASGSLRILGTLPPVAFLGNVSYSFYLIQLPVMLTVTSYLYPLTGSILLSVSVSLACSLAVSYAIYRLVEIPTQNWGRGQSQAVGARIAAFASQRHHAALHGADPS